MDWRTEADVPRNRLLEGCAESRPWLVGEPRKLKAVWIGHLAVMLVMSARMGSTHRGGMTAAPLAACIVFSCYAIGMTQLVHAAPATLVGAGSCSITRHQAAARAAAERTRRPRALTPAMSIASLRRHKPPPT